jgi:hypothetical protein
VPCEHRRHQVTAFGQCLSHGKWPSVPITSHLPVPGITCRGPLASGAAPRSHVRSRRRPRTAMCTWSTRLNYYSDELTVQRHTLGKKGVNPGHRDPLSFLPVRISTSPEDFGDHLVQLLSRTNRRLVKRTGAQPSDLLAAAKVAMLLLPPVPPVKRLQRETPATTQLLCHHGDLATTWGTHKPSAGSSRSLPTLRMVRIWLDGTSAGIQSRSSGVGPTNTDLVASTRAVAEGLPLPPTVGSRTGRSGLSWTTHRSPDAPTLITRPARSQRCRHRSPRHRSGLTALSNRSRVLIANARDESLDFAPRTSTASRGRNWSGCGWTLIVVETGYIPAVSAHYPGVSGAGRGRHLRSSNRFRAASGTVRPACRTTSDVSGQRYPEAKFTMDTR